MEERKPQLNLIVDRPVVWADRHNAAVRGCRADEQALVKLLLAWREYASEYRTRYDQPIGQDGYASDYWEEIGRAIRGLLSMDHGQRLDCGTLDAFLLDVAEDNDCTLE